MTTPETTRTKSAAPLAAMLAAALLAACSGGGGGYVPVVPPVVTPPEPEAQAPNILFIVMDDLGLDQLSLYGYGGRVPPKTPNIDAIARAGLRFRNAWSMPTCTPTRASYFVGRYPSSTNILNAVVSTDLANSEISPYEMTLPKLLKTRGYTNALIGKMHLTGTDLNNSPNLPYGHQTMWKLGWDHFDGYLDGAPYPIDTRAGRTGVEAGTYKCGFVPNASVDPANGADAGACYLATGECAQLSRGGDISTPGRTCMERGGIFDPGQSCQASRPGYLDFSAQNGYYTGEWIQSWADGRTRKVTAEDPSARGYRSTMETDRAIAWARQQPADKPWMLSLGYSAIHTPLQVPPVSLIAADTLGRDDNLVCYPRSDSENEGPKSALNNAADLIDSHLVTNLMVEAMDTEIGRLLVELGLASHNSDGSLNYQPEKTNTVVVVTGDNGTYVNSVKFTEPGRFDPTRAKGFPYQTGVSVPLIVAGPMVRQAGREVAHPVNSTDLYRLFAEIAGADVDSAIPASRPLDARPMQAYLTDPGQGAIRSVNFTEMGTNFSNPTTSVTPKPCVVEAANVCFTIFPAKALCDDQGGVWYGEGSVLPGVPPGGYGNCCQVQQHRSANDQSAVDILPNSQKAASDGQHKLVRLSRNQCVSTGSDPVADWEYEKDAGGNPVFAAIDEFYRIDMAMPNPTLDRSGSALAAGPVPLATTGLSAEQQRAYATLKAELDQRDAVASYNRRYDADHCPGDGNRDFVVDQTDLDNWQELSQLNGGQSSWYDFNHDGRTDAADRAIIQANLGRRCTPLAIN